MQRPAALNNLDALSHSGVYLFPRQKALVSVGAALDFYYVPLGFYRAGPQIFAPGVKVPLAAWWCGHQGDAYEHGNMVSDGSPVCTDSQGWLLVWRSVLQHVYRVSSQWVTRLANRLSRFKFSSVREYSPHGITQRASVWRGISMRW